MSLDPATTPAEVRGRPTSIATKLLVPLAIGAGVAVALGTYGRVHEPTGVGVLYGRAPLASTRCRPIRPAAA